MDMYGYIGKLFNKFLIQNLNKLAKTTIFTLNLLALRAIVGLYLYRVAMGGLNFGLVVIGEIILRYNLLQ